MQEERDYWRSIGFPKPRGGTDWASDTHGYIDTALAGFRWLEKQGLAPDANVAAALLAVARRASQNGQATATHTDERMVPPEFDFEPATTVLRARYMSDHGQRIWALINSSEARQAMKAVARLGRPAILGLESMLLEKGLIRPKDEVDDNERATYDLDLRLIGQMAKQVLVREGAIQRGRKPVTNSRIWGTGTFFEFPVR